MSSYRRYPSDGNYKANGKTLLKKLSTRKQFIDCLKSQNGWYGIYFWGRDEIELKKKSEPNSCGENIVCCYMNRMSFHTHTPHYDPDHKYLPPSCVDIMLTFKESFLKKKPTYSLLIDGSGFYFYRPSDNLFKSVMEQIAKKKNGWAFDMWKSWMKHTEDTKLINDRMDKWNSYIFDIDVKDRLKKKNFKTVNECLQHYYRKIGFDIYFIANDDKKCFNIFEEKIVNLVD